MRRLVISGSTRIGDNWFIGVNAAIGDNLNIGSRAVIDAGALILRDGPDGSVYAPAIPRHRKYQAVDCGVFDAMA